MTIPTGNIRAARAVATALVALGITACQPSREPAANEAAETPANVEAESNMAVSGNAVAAEEPEEAKKSIIRPDVEPSPTPTPPAEPVELTVPFPAKGAQPDPAGIALLDTLAADPVLALGGPITIWGHSDSSGSDASNLIASRKRAEAARDYLVKKGVAAERITVIALGEARPIAPNRKLDGSDDPKGRDKNRRVEIKVDLPKAAPAAEGSDLS
ncbi:OmpA family protein [Sphingomonas yabuuchiae]|uniref:OOP family OmpA-OmpF porin n=1 Tax=Sphingomonas yabuuchiae TaxID=172044 RepID=A0AA41DBY6_9SPHN|nr:OmpA family protein [Sphingomonas yabuuchiae]MBB4609284.1 OOP family OmpA-OmpF porin [Sphingomonas yabuuchiae]MBN3558581.1 OmpA family protein [Sphingomonas yabuuchiae]